MEQQKMKKIAIVGASSSIAQHCTRIWNEKQTCEFILIGRNNDKLEKIGADLKVRNPDSSVSTAILDFEDPLQIQTTINRISSDRPIDIALIAHGSLPIQEQCQKDLTICQQSLTINAISPVLFCEALLTQMCHKDHGTLALIGSVAGDRGRKTNYLYGAAKGLLERYIQGVQHRVAKSHVHALLIKPGPTDTPMTAHLSEMRNTLAPVKQVANSIVQGIDKKRPIIYAPAKWALIMLIIRHIPRFIFNKLNI